jgi:hypothetical protein
MLVDLTGSALLTGKVIALPTEKKTAQQELAEAILELNASFVGALTTLQLDRVKMAVALQMNYQVEQGTDAFVLESQSSNQQGESRSWRDGAVHPQAKAIVDGIEIDTGDGSADVAAFGRIRPVRSLRTAGSGGVPGTPRGPGYDS